MKQIVCMLFSLLIASSAIAGQCDSPYDYKRNGDRCGATSRDNEWGQRRTEDPYDSTGRNPDSWNNRYPN